MQSLAPEMADHMSTDSKARKKALIDIFDKDEAVALRGIEKLTDVGSPDVIKPLVEVHRGTESDSIKARIEALLNSLKAEGVVAPVVELLQDEDFKESRRVLLAGLWNSGLFPSEYMDVITASAIEGDFLCAIEAVTVVENMEPPFNADVVEEACFQVQIYLDQGIEEDKRDLLLSLQETLDSFRTQAAI